jgi:D-alanyl-D-alanine carboxypeptidase
VRITQVQLLHVVVHHLHKLRLPARHVIGQRQGNPVFDGSSLMFLKEGDRVTVRDLSRGLIVDSGDNVIRRNAMAINSPVDHIARHQLGEARRVTLLMVSSAFAAEPLDFSPQPPAIQAGSWVLMDYTTGQILTAPYGDNVIRRNAMAINSPVDHIARHQLGEARRVT